MDVSRKEAIKEKILNTEDLPTLPSTVGKILELVDNPKTTAGMLSELINTDPVLAAKVLKVANSAFFGFPKRISTLNLAIVILGFSSLKHLCLGVGIMNIWEGSESESGLNMNGFWSHSIATGVAAKLLARKVRYDIPGEAFVAGLIHDIGKLLLNNLVEEYQDVLKESEKKEFSLSAIEEKMLGVGHDQVGGWLIERWNLPPELVESIAAHHSSNGFHENQLFKIIRSADSLAHHAGIGNSGNYVPVSFEEEVADLFSDIGIDKSEINIDEIIIEYENELENSKAFFNLRSNGNS